MYCEEGIEHLRVEVLKQAIDDWIWWQLYGDESKLYGNQRNLYLQRKKDADRAWRFLNNKNENLWLFTELTPDAVVRIAKARLEMKREGMVSGVKE